MEYQGPNRSITDRIMRDAGIVTVMGRDQVTDIDGHIKSEYVTAAVKAIWDEGLPAELTFRLPESVLTAAMPELIEERAARYRKGEEVILGVGSIECMSELEKALDMGFDFVVSPGNGVGGEYESEGKYYDPIEFVKKAHAKNVYAAPATETHDGLGFYFFRDDGNEPDALKIFNSADFVNDITGDVKKFAGILAPSVRTQGRFITEGRIIMPTGAVTRWSAPLFREAIEKNKYSAVLGMSDPLSNMKGKATATIQDYVDSIKAFKAALKRNQAAYEADKSLYMNLHAKKIIEAALQARESGE